MKTIQLTDQEALLIEGGSCGERERPIYPRQPNPTPNLNPISVWP